MDDCPLLNQFALLKHVKAPFGKAHRIDDDGVIDFNDYAKDGDKVTIITTFPLNQKMSLGSKWNMVVSSSSKKG